DEPSPARSHARHSAWCGSRCAGTRSDQSQKTSLVCLLCEIPTDIGDQVFHWPVLKPIRLLVRTQKRKIIVCVEGLTRASILLPLEIVAVVILVNADNGVVVYGVQQTGRDLNQCLSPYCAKALSPLPRPEY